MRSFLLCMGMAVTFFQPLGAKASAGSRLTEAQYPSRIDSTPGTVSVRPGPSVSPVRSEPVQRVAILVPGTLNSIVPGTISLPDLHQNNPYFSDAIVGALESQGFITYVVRGLGWCSQLELNGDITLAEIRKWYLERFPHADAPITIVAHSAGGFYALQALSNAPELPIEQVYLLSTPLLGSKLANDILSNWVIGNAVQKIIDATSGILDLRGLPAMSTANTQAFLSKMRPPSNVKIYSLGGSQPINWNPLQVLNPDYMSPLLFVTANWIGEESDGIVELRSALGSGTLLTARESGATVQIHALPELHMNLDHIEQFLDYHLLGPMSTADRERIRDEQSRVYGALAHLALSQAP